MLGRGKHSSKTSHKNFMYYDVTLGFFVTARLLAVGTTFPSLPHCSRTLTSGYDLHFSDSQYKPVMRQTAATRLRAGLPGRTTPPSMLCCSGLRGISFQGVNMPF